MFKYQTGWVDKEARGNTLVTPATEFPDFAAGRKDLTCNRLNRTTGERYGPNRSCREHQLHNVPTPQTNYIMSDCTQRRMGSELETANPMKMERSEKALCPNLYPG